MTIPIQPSRSVAPPTLAAALADRFPIERELGQGGMATVYLARDLKHGRMVAVKVLRPEVGVLLGRERFEQEVRVASSLSHPNIVPVYDSGEAGGFLYYVMPAMDGEALSSRLQRERHLPIEESVRLLAEIADALDYAHAREIVHRDIKPGNILLSGGHALVADFGIALALSKVDGERMTETGLSVGTPAYMSPEQAAGHRSVDGRSDQYSLACVFYEMLGGDPPFTGSTPRSVMARHIADPPPSLATLRPGLSGGIEAAVKRALAKVPADRFETTGAFARAVAGASAGPSAAPQRTTWRPSRRALLSAGAIAVIAAVGWGSWQFWPRGAPINSVALLPPENAGRDSALDYQVKGVYEQVTTALARVRGLRIKPETATLPYWREQRSIADVVRGLDVDAVLSTSVIPAADSFRLTLRLIRGESQDIAWTLDTTVAWASVVQLASAAAREITAEAGSRLTRTQERQLAEARAVDPRAFDLVQKALHSGTPEQKVAWLRQAINTDGTYPDAYAALARLMVQAAQYGFMTPGIAGPQARAAAQRATQFDSSSAVAWEALAEVRFWFDWDVPGAMEAGARAEALGGRSNQSMLLLTGRFDEAIPIYDQIARDNPLDFESNINPCWSRINAHRFAEAIPHCRRTAATFPGQQAWAHFEMAWAFVGMGLRDSALAAMRRTGVEPGTLDDIVWLGAEAVTYGKAGRMADARRSVARLVVLTRSPEADPYPLAAAYAAIGDDANALRYFERVYRERWPSMMFAYVEPNWPERFRALPRVQEILRLAGFPAAPPDLAPRAAP